MSQNYEKCGAFAPVFIKNLKFWLRVLTPVSSSSSKRIKVKKVKDNKVSSQYLSSDNYIVPSNQETIRSVAAERKLSKVGELEALDTTIYQIKLY